MEFFASLEQSGVGTWVNQSDSVLAYPTILFLHTIGLTLLVAINIAIDLRILGFAPQMPVAEMQKLFPLMWTGLATNAVTGVLLLIAKATQFIVNPAFYVKMASIVFAVLILFATRAAVFRDPLQDKGPIRMNGKVLASLSIALWLVAITAGRVMAYVGEAAEFATLILK